MEKSAAERKQQAEARAAALAELVVTIKANAGDEGKLFGSVGARDIAQAITAAGVAVSKAEVKLPSGALRDIGEYSVDVQLHVDVMQPVKLVIEAE